MIDYTSHLEQYLNSSKNVKCKSYLVTFVNLASSSNIPIHELNEFHETWKHQIGRPYTKNVRYTAGTEVRRFIKYLDEKTKLKYKENKGMKIVSHN